MVDATTPTVVIHDPVYEVTLFKTIKREVLVDGVPVSGRFSGTTPRVDLSPYLGEGSSIVTSKGVHEAAGAFQLTLLDKPFIGYLADVSETAAAAPVSITAESVYGIIEPMDVIEIRLRHIADGSAVAPIVMRGFVSRIGRTEGVDAEGRPQRRVQISGQDYGKIWQQLIIRYLPGYVIGEDILTAFRFFERFGGALENATKAGDMVRSVLAVMNKYLAGLFASGDSDAPNQIFLDEAQLVQHGTTSLTGPQNHEGAIYDLLRTYLDVGPWNELFLEDREDGVYLVCRPNPFNDASNQRIVSDGPAVTVTNVPAEDIVSMNVERSDANVANYYWVRSMRFELVADTPRRQLAMQTVPDDKTVLLGGYANSSVDLYGIRIMETDTQMGGDDVASFNSGLAEADMVARDTSMVNWTSSRRALLVLQNRDNVLFERGSMRIKGNEKIKPGTYINLKRGTFEAEYYVTNVVHEYIPYGAFFSTLTLERGRGFIERVKREGGSQSPYLAEMA